MSTDTIHADTCMTRMQAAAILKLHNAWRRGDGKYTSRTGEIGQAIDIAVAELERAADCHSCWRDVSEELPQEAQEVLFVRGGKVVHGAWIGGIFWHSNQKMAAEYWMPLPLPPNA